jgi:dTDP-4-dehydrorhamnose reductase
MTSVVVLGSSGMLGSTVIDVLARDRTLQVAGTVRTPALLAACAERLPQADWRAFKVEADDDELTRVLDGTDWVINAIGLTKPYIKDDQPSQVEAAIRVNAVFPFRLAKAAERVGAHVIQIATDCVYSGSTGAYFESSPHDPIDVYGKSKSLGEAALPNMHHFRCSIIGPEPKSPSFLLEWLRGQPAGATVSGYTDHMWNGVTTLAFGRLCLGLVRGRVIAPLSQHVIPAGVVSKADLLALMAGAYGRSDINIKPVKAPSPIDRTLRTENPGVNAALWTAAGYAAPPSVAEMVAESATYAPRLAEL